MTKQEFINLLKNGHTPKPFFLFAGKGYDLKHSNFTIYQEFDSLTEFLQQRQSYIENGLNVVSCAL
jgi:hypothetical protein